MIVEAELIEVFFNSYKWNLLQSHSAYLLNLIIPIFLVACSSTLVYSMLVVDYRSHFEFLVPLNLILSETFHF